MVLNRDPEEAIMVGQINFQGEAPFALPGALGAVAAERNGLVVATFSVVVPGRGPAPVQVEIAMSQVAADFLATQLAQAALDAAKIQS